MDDQQKALVREIASEAASKAVRETLVTLGIDVKDPLEAQSDFAMLREMRDLIKDPELQKDLLHIRKWRLAMQGVENKGLLAVMVLLATGAVAFLLSGFKIKFGG